MKQGWAWERCGVASAGRWFLRNEHGAANQMSIIRRKSGWFLVDDDRDLAPWELQNCPVIAGPMPLKAAKVAYLLNIKDSHFDW